MKRKAFSCHINRLLLQWFCFAGAVLIAAGLPGTAPAQNTILVDRIVAVVNDEIITLYDLDKEFEPYARNIRSLGYSEEKQQTLLFKFRSDLLSKLIDSRLADQEIKKNNLDVTEAEIDSAIERIKTRRSMTDEALRAALAQEGLTMEEYREEVKAQMLRSELVNLEVKSKIVVTQQNIEAYYKEHIEKYTAEKKIHLWNIYMPVSDESQRKAALENMETIKARLDQGAQFKALAKDEFLASLGAGGGDLGLFLAKELSGEIMAALKNLNDGEYTSIIPTGNVYQIIYLDKTVQAQSKSIEDVQGEIEQILYREIVDNKYQEWLEELRSRSHIKIIQ
jgi:peptidyl-prolyl cis-trans isomerase SurA